MVSPCRKRGFTSSHTNFYRRRRKPRKQKIYQEVLHEKKPRLHQEVTQNHKWTVLPDLSELRESANKSCMRENLNNVLSNMNRYEAFQALRADNKDSPMTKTKDFEKLTGCFKVMMDTCWDSECHFNSSDHQGSWSKVTAPYPRVGRHRGICLILNFQCILHVFSI